jgi:hypothetical protein
MSQINYNNNLNSMPVNSPYKTIPAYTSVPDYTPSSQPYEQFSLETTYVKNYVALKIKKANPINVPWLSDPSIKQALQKLAEVEYLPGDVEHMKNLGVNLIFKNGQEAIKTLIDKKINIVFAPVSNPKVHAQWGNNNNTIVINEKYRNTQNLAEILAISEAIFHEAGHAKDSDNLSSLQEEIDCLALNTLANRYHQYMYIGAFNSNSSDIINNGVSLYTKLFFDSDSNKTALAKRILEKYGELPINSPNHPTLLPSIILNSINIINKN